MTPPQHKKDLLNKNLLIFKKKKYNSINIYRVKIL